jgi:release factor glutamine methyltransferase
VTRRIAEVTAEVTRDLAAAGIDGAARDARALVALATGRDPARLTLEADAPVEADALARLAEIVAVRAARRPLSHITRERAFWEHVFTVTPDVLDPRPETETLVHAALGRPIGRLLDLGTGSGAIALSLLAARPGAQAVATDISDAALAVARGNAARLGVEGRIALLRSDWFAAVRGRFDLIVSNPPYIARDEMAGLAPELAFEPRGALTDEADGLTAYRAIAAGAPAHLAPDGRLIVEIGPSQGAAVARLFAAAGLREVTIGQDLDGRDRMVSARGPAGAP